MKFAKIKKKFKGILNKSCMKFKGNLKKIFSKILRIYEKNIENFWEISD